MFKWLGYFFLGLHKHGWSIFHNFRKFGGRDLRIEVADAFVKSVEKEEEGYIRIAEQDIIPFCEQIVYRTIECAKCLENKQCEHCTCEFPSKMETPEQKCPIGEWDAIMPKQEWDEYKQRNNIKDFTYIRA